MRLKFYLNSYSFTVGLYSELTANSLTEYGLMVSY